MSLVGAALLSGGLSGSLGLGDGLMLVAALLRAFTVCQTSRLTRGSTAPTLALTAVLWLGESLSLSGWLGGGLIVLAALWTTVRQR